jgi:hypothetical protein
MIAGRVTCVAVLDFSRRMAEAIPDAFALAVFVPCAFDLIRRGRCAPDEIFRKKFFRHSQSPKLISSLRAAIG